MPPRPGSARKSGKKKKEAKPPSVGQDAPAAAPAEEVTPEAKAAAQAHKATGNTAFAAGSYKEAIEAFTKAIESDPTDHVFFSNRSASYASLENYKAAIADAEQCVTLNPAWSKGYSRLGLAKFKAGDLTGARAAYKAGLKVDKGSQALADGLHEVEVAAKAAQRAQGQEVNRLAEELAGGATVGGAGGGGGESKPVDHVIGIDLGTTFSCVAVWRNGEPEVLTNSEGERTTPSWVAFTEQGRVVGAPAKRQAAMNTKNTLFNIKRIIGRQFGECYDEVKRMPFAVEEGPGGRPVVKVDVDGKQKTFAPEQVSAMVLEKMKATAEVALGCKVSKAVVTVPAYFNDAQRRLTKDAGAIAGLEVLRIINEPTAAALAYGLDKGAKDSGKDSQTILVFDLGGGTFDVSLLKIEGGMFEVLATAGDTHLGGEDFDSVLADWVANQVRKKKGKELFKDDDRAMRKLRTACEQAKRQLSSSMSTRVELYMGDEEISVEVTRALFEKLCEQTFQRCLEAVKRCLADAKLKKEDVSEIVLVGGSTRVPRVQAILSEHFGGRPLCKSVHPDEAVAFGAAVQGAILAGVRDASTQDLLLVDVTPLSLGVECEGNHFSRVVMRNTSIPCKCTSEFTTVEDYQTEVDIRIFEGERQNTDGNHLLGEFQIKGIERAKRGEAKVEVTFEVSTNGLLNVYARDKMTGAKADVSIQHDRGRLTSDDIERMVAEAEAMRQQDEERERELMGEGQ